MNRKTPLFACLAALLGLSGCVLYKTTTTQESAHNQDALVDECQGVNCETDPFINYTQTRANYRQYGELSPRDQMVSQSGAGNNISASIPPSIENEVITYQEKVKVETPEDLPNDEIVIECDVEPCPQTIVADNNEPAPETVKEVEQSNQEVKNDTSAPSGEDPVQDWYAEEGQNLKALLTKWSEESGWRLVWNTNRNYVLNAGAMFRGRFADVSSALIRAFARARPAPIATFYKGNRVLVVETMEDENAYD